MTGLNRITYFYIALFALLFFAFITVSKTNERIPNEHSPKYELVKDWLQLPKDFRLSQVVGISVDRDQNIVFFQRTGRQWTDPFPDSLISSNTIFVLNKSGKILSSWGANLFIMPHGLTVDNENNIWVTD